MWTSRQIAAYIQAIAIFLIMYDIFVCLLKNKKGFSILFMLIATGISGQFMFEVFGDATYGTIILLSILELDLYLRFMRKEKNNYLYLIAFGIILAFVTSCSLRFPIYISAPLLCCSLYDIYKNKIEKKKMYMFIVIIVATLIGYLMHKYLANHLFFMANYGGNILNNDGELNLAIQKIIFNYLWINGATYLDVFSLTQYIDNSFLTQDSPYIILTFIKVIFSLLIIINPIVILKKFNKLDENEKFITIFVSSFIFILLFFLIFGRMYVWYRYLTPAIFELILLLPISFKYYFNSNFKDKLFCYISLFLVCLTSIILVVNSVYDIENKELRKSPSQSFAEFLLKNDLHNGYCYTDREHNVYYLLTNGQVRITRLNRDGSPDYWLSSKDWFTPNYTKGKVFFVRYAEEDPLEFEDEAIEILTYNDYEIVVFNDISPFIEHFKKINENNKN